MTAVSSPRLRSRVLIAIAIALAFGALGVAAVDPWSLAHGARLAERSAALPALMGLAFDAGLWLFYAGFLAVFAFGLWRRQRSLIAIALTYLAAELVFAAGLVRLLKIACGRPRPYLGDVAWSCFSFGADFHSLPSGHAADVMVGVAVIEISSRSPWLRAAAGAVAVSVMAARVLQGQHYLSDVAIGGLIGYLGGVGCVALLQRWSRPAG